LTGLSNSFRKKVRSWLLKNPQLNPYKQFKPGFFRFLTNPFRVLPDFILIGAGKCGTTSLYDNLIKHPQILESRWKEVHYFDSNFKAGLNWYKAHFPSSIEKYYLKQKHKHNFIIGEASPYYLIHPLAAKRVFETIPKVKLIVLLRNPTDRAYSHYNHVIRTKDENLSFEEAIKNEEKMLVGEIEKIIENENYDSWNLKVFSYLARGMYYDQLKVWMTLFPTKQFLILKTEDYLKDPNKILNQVFSFLNVSNYNMNNLQKSNVGKYKSMNDSTRKYLIDYFKPPK